MRKCAFVLTFATVVSVGLAGPASAAPITVPNFSFEEPVTAGYIAFPTDLHGWGGNDGAVGVQNVSSLPEGMSGATGDQAGYCNNGSSLWSTDSVTELTVSTSYTLTVDVGSRFDFPSSGFELRFFAGDPLAGGTQFATTGSLAPPTVQNSMQEYQLSYTVLPGDAVAGKELYIMLSNSGGSNQTSFDNVRLDATAVPEPSTLFGLATGLLCLLTYARRRRR